MASQTRSAGLGQSIVMLGGTDHWSNPTNIYTSNNVYASKGLDGDEVTHWLRATDFGFTIPDDVTIDGIIVEIERRCNEEYGADYAMKIVKAGSEQGIDHVSATEWPQTDTYESYGSSSDKWGLTWTVGQINSHLFGASISAIYEDDPEFYATFYVDHIRITVYYTEPSVGKNQKINIGDSWKIVEEIKINIGDVWKTVTNMQINIGDIWKNIFG